MTTVYSQPMFKKLTKAKILDALSIVKHPKTGQDIVTSGSIDEIIIDNGTVNITMMIDPNTAEIMEGVRKRCDEAVAKLSGVKLVRTVMTAHAATGQSAPQKSAGNPTQKPPAKTRGLWTRETPPAYARAYPWH